jgi:hypothetical protein
METDSTTYPDHAPPTDSGHNPPAVTDSSASTPTARGTRFAVQSSLRQEGRRITHSRLR